ncbi:MAG: curli-like amyloid fiber formation chaperone CsgH [Bacteroidota bacterium]
MLHLLTLLLLAGCALNATPPEPVSPSSARIEVDRQPDRYELTGVYTGPVTEDLTYRLEVTREGQSGRSRSSQGGAVLSDTLSTSTVNVSDGDRVTARLTILDRERVIAEDRLDEVVDA